MGPVAGPALALSPGPAKDPAVAIVVGRLAGDPNQALWGDDSVPLAADAACWLGAAVPETVAGRGLPAAAKQAPA